MDSVHSDGADRAESQKERIEQIRQRLAGVTGKPWKYNPKHEMFIGTTNALDMYYEVLDLGRDHKEWFRYSDESGHGYRLTEASLKRMARTKALGEFLEQCREDIAYLLEVAALLGQPEGR